MRKSRWATWMAAAFAVCCVVAFALRAGVRESAAHPASLRAALPQLEDTTTTGTGCNVVLICIDTLRADHMSLYGYSRATTPRIDAFARDARVFDRAYATAPFTTPSVVSMLTGLYPYRHGVRVLWQPIDDDVVTVADWLRRAGYQTSAIVSNLVLTDEACGLGSRFQYYDDAVDEPEPNRPEMLERRAARTTDAALRWLRTQRNPRQPFFLWVHYIDPHGPYRPPREFAGRFSHAGSLPVDAERVADYVVDPAVTDMLDYVDRYDEEIRYADHEVGRLFDALDELKLAADTALILTADHGEYLLEREAFAFCHGFGVDDAVTRVPLIVRHPTMQPSREAQPVSIADVAPTVLAFAGISIPKGLDGKSLTGEITDRAPYIEGPDPKGSGGLERALVYSQRKVVVRHGLSNIVRAQWVFDLIRDPGERTRLAVGQDDPARAALADLMRNDSYSRAETGSGSGGRSQLVADDLDAKTLEKLRGLGYVE